MSDHEDPVEGAIDDVEQLLAPDDDSDAGEDMAADNDPGLPPGGDDPMDGSAPSG